MTSLPRAITAVAHDLLRDVWLDFGNGEVSLVNEAIVRAGYGAFYTYPPDVKYVEQIQAANTFAREHQLGLWSASGGNHEPLTAAPVATSAAPQPTAAPQPVPTVAAPQTNGCDPSYPGVCIPSPPPDLNCRDVPYRRFIVLPPDPHGFDGDHDGVGCE